MGTKTILFRDLSCPNRAREAALDLANRAISNQEVLSGSRTKAIDDLSEQYGFQSFLKKLTKGQGVSLHLHLYVRLCQAVEETADRLERKIEHDRMISRAARGEHAAISSTEATPFGRVGITASAA